MKLKVYLDTTVISAAEDGRAPERRAETLAFLARADEFSLVTSELTRAELSATPDPGRKCALLSRLNNLRVMAVSAEIMQLAKQYVNNAIIPSAYEDDAIHIAAAVVSGQDVLASWNFRHMVNRRRRSLVNLMNASRGLPTVEIVTPSEL